MDVVFRSRIVFAVIAAFVFSSCSQEKKSSKITGMQDLSAACESQAIKDRFVVYWKDGSVSFEKAEDKEAFINDVMTPHEDEIQFAEHDMILRLPNTPAVSEEASFSTKAAVPADWGQSRIEAPAVWTQGHTGKGVIVAVVDSGVDLTHVQLNGQLAHNSRESLNGIDDDRNGLIDDVTGFDFFNQTGDVKDGSGHGTHVSGIILADHDTGSVRGVAPEARLLPLRFMNDRGEGTVSGAINSILYAADRGAKVINASWGAGSCSASLRQAVADLEERGILFVAAAGNEGSNLDHRPEYPAAFSLPGQLTIAASTYREARAAFSNFSYSLVHLAAPGQEIYSTYPGSSRGTGFPSDRVQKLDGTSMAAPFVSGVAAVLYGVRPTATVHQIRQAITESVDRDPNEPLGTYPVATGGRLNLKKAVLKIQAMIP